MTRVLIVDDDCDHAESLADVMEMRGHEAQIANTADQLGPRTVEPSDPERRAVVLDKYRRGAATGAERGPDERVQVKN